MACRTHPTHALVRGSIRPGSVVDRGPAGNHQGGPITKINRAQMFPFLSLRYWAPKRDPGVGESGIKGWL
jgi:hypothetical protein